jgi:LysR family transcriptional regulator, glycine cleavage system transcriptional activator
VEAIRVGTVPSFARLWLLPNLARLESRPADLRIEIEIDHRLMALSRSRVAIRFGRGDWPGISATRLFSETLRPVATRDIAEQLGVDVSVSDLLAQPLLHDGSDSAWRHWLGMETLGRRPKDRILPGYDLAMIAAGVGEGVALARWPYGRHYIEKAGMIFLSPRLVENSNAFYLVTSLGERTEPVNRLISRMQAVASEEVLASAPLSD